MRTDRPIVIHTLRQPTIAICVWAPTIATLKPIATITEKTPIAIAKRVVNHLPTLVTLIVDSALCPTVRVKIKKAITVAAVIHWLMVMTKQPNKINVPERVTRMPKRSVSGPAIKAPAVPSKVAIILNLAYSVRVMPNSEIKDSVISPKPTVRPGKVATMASAARATIIHP